MSEWFDSSFTPPNRILIFVPDGCELITTIHGTYAVHKNWLKPPHTLKRWRKD